MKEKLLILHSTMMHIETKGQSTKTMAQCLGFVEQLIAECDKPEE